MLTAVFKSNLLLSDIKSSFTAFTGLLCFTGVIYEKVLIAPGYWNCDSEP